MHIRNPVEWSLDFIRSAGSVVDTVTHVGPYREGGALPSIRRIELSDLGDALARGIDDFAAYRTDVIFLCAIYPIAGLILARLAFGYDMLPLLFPLASGFALIGPFAAVGLYEISRQRERGGSITWSDTFAVFHSHSLGAIVVLGLLLMAIFLGNHDTICMVPGLETMGIRMLLNESEPVTRDGESIYLSGIDDAHYYRVDNIEKAASEIPEGAFSILLSHTPEIYRQAAHAGFDLLLGGHTHGGQICLPGSIPITLDSVLPRRMGSGAWEYHDMAGYTSAGVGSCIVAVRLNCPPEITLHRLQRG
jgi:hypothetical protein